ncbi:MAG: type II secretion system protein GspM [Deltaproteobacteria bacterium]|nr:type II secretion system protein GspM [Deltaproteobacteria bacterium]
MKIPSWEELKGEFLNLIIDKRRRYLLIAGGVLLLFGLAFRLFPFFEGIQGGETDIDAQKKRIAKYQQTVQGRGELEARLASLNKSLERAEAGLLTGKTAALAAVDIQNILNEIALGSGVEIKSAQVLKSQQKDSEQYISVPVAFTVSATIRQLKDILYKIEASPKFFLTVERIGISVAGAGSPGQMRADITVSGIMKNVKE